jgi:hypothetical protein
MDQQAYAIAAELVVAVHFAWIVFLIGGAVIGRRNRAVRALHLAGLGYSVLLQLNGWICPLTYLELWLRERGRAADYRGSFLAHYLERLIYLQVAPEWVLLGTGLIIGLAAALYLRRV